MSPEQLVVFLEDHAQMERLESLAEQQKVQQIQCLLNDICMMIVDWPGLILATTDFGWFTKEDAVLASFRAAEGDGSTHEGTNSLRIPFSSELFETIANEEQFYTMGISLNVSWVETFTPHVELFNSMGWRHSHV